MFPTHLQDVEILCSLFLSFTARDCCRSTYSRSRELLASRQYVCHLIIRQFDKLYSMICTIFSVMMPSRDAFPD